MRTRLLNMVHGVEAVPLGEPSSAFAHRASRCCRSFRACHCFGARQPARMLATAALAAAALAAAALVALPAALGASPAARADDPARDRPLVIQAERIHTAVGEPLKGGVVVIRGGLIAALGPDAEIPAGARRLNVPGAVLTPGLIDANCALDFEIPQHNLRGEFGAAPTPAAPRVSPRPPGLTLWERVAARGPLTQHHHHLHAADEDCTPACVCGPACSGLATVEELFALGPSPRLTWAEQSSEVTPHLNVIESVNLLANDFRRLLRGGVTTVFVAPDSASVIGMRGAIVRTGGLLRDRVVERSHAVKATLGRDAISRGRSNTLPPTWGPDVTIYTRRPTTRMGVEWVFRKAFHDAIALREGRTPYGADTPSDPALAVLQQVLAGEIPLRIQARTQKDILSALRQAKEFGLKFTLEEGTEAYLCLNELKAAGTPVIYGPIYMDAQGFRAFTGEVNEPRLSAPRRLLDAGIPMALTAHEFRDEEGLIRQAMFAARYGLSEDEALRAVTVEPARRLGLPDGWGTLSAGAPADLVVWSGEPLAATSRVEAVVIAGRVVYERRRATDD